jgi:hypothetical protein
MNKGYTHGPIQCRACFPHDEESLDMGDWRLQNNPGYYGSENPSVLILGFSKGANQNKEAKSGDFDNIAFSGARHRLQKILETLGLMPSGRSINEIMTAEEKEFGVASLVRCSFGKMKNGTYKTSGDVIPSSFSNSQTLQIIQRCTEMHLGELPSRVKLVILLGTSDNYIKKTKSMISKLFDDFKNISEVAFTARGALWIYATHPSPGNGHFESWISDGSGIPSARKRTLAITALNNLKI